MKPLGSGIFKEARASASLVVLVLAGAELIALFLPFWQDEHALFLQGPKAYDKGDARVRAFMILLVLIAFFEPSRLHGQNADDCLNRGLYAVSKGDPATASLEFLQAIQLNPKRLALYQARLPYRDTK